MNPLLQQIKLMHNKFRISTEMIPFGKDEKQFRHTAMLEELEEYAQATTKEDELDAIVDLVAFALGTAERQGFLDVFEEAFNRVMEANLKKEIGQNQKRGNFVLDLVKPEGWEPSDLSDLVSKKEVSFTEWLFTEQERDQSDTVTKFKNKYSANLNWNIGINSLNDLQKFITQDIDDNLKASLFAATVAWQDYEEFKNE
jgi:predicted HAD superfamily Cof-like phosphohydrolase